MVQITLGNNSAHDNKKNTHTAVPNTKGLSEGFKTSGGNMVYRCTSRKARPSENS